MPFHWETGRQKHVSEDIDHVFPYLLDDFPRVSVREVLVDNTKVYKKKQQVKQTAENGNLEIKRECLIFGSKQTQQYKAEEPQSPIWQNRKMHK